ncbi:alanine racemase [Oceanibacterium hippocampi]|uniref:Alanine racemase n=1 Tax=Oceanibacterium hippocampi TaxID=745714 RepID=A0A1Y5STE4_9PROT|nr:alanine racemase [Oceanibacterium hippocampi]SLN47990.1 Alanine racemase, catabolic [Oceanibacterium hippocampi]
MSATDRAGATLTIDLDAIARNYATLCDRATPARVAGVVKANGYGLGADRVASRLWKAGCRDFFVALPEEGIRLRRHFRRYPPAGPDGGAEAPRIHVLCPMIRGIEADLVAHDLIPVLNNPAELALWAAATARHGRLPAALHLDTGMTRLGFIESELDMLSEKPELAGALDIRFVMTHLACADLPEHPLNEEQRRLFSAMRDRLPAPLRALPASFANSSGIFLGPAFHGEMVRPGVALYGVNPTPSRPNPMAQVVQLQGKIVQVHEIDRGRTVGYGAAHPVTRKARIATVPVGYADGYLRALGGQGHCAVNGVRVPIVGRISMDLTTLDVSALPEAATPIGTPVELIGPTVSLDELAGNAGTIGYEILTGLGRRYHRVYRTRSEAV